MLAIYRANSRTHTYWGISFPRVRAFAAFMVGTLAFLNVSYTQNLPNRIITLEDREAEVKIDVNVQLSAWVTPGQLVGITNGLVPFYRANLGKIQATFTCIPRNLGNYSLRVLADINPNEFDIISAPRSNWCNHAMEFKPKSVGAKKLPFRVIFESASGQKDEKRIEFDVEILGFREENGFERMSQIAQAPPSISIQEKLETIATFIDAYDDFPSQGRGSKRIKQGLGELKPKINVLEAQLASGLDFTRMEDVKTYFQVFQNTNSSVLQRFKEKANTYVRELEENKWQEAISTQSFTAIEAYATNFCQRWDELGFSCSHMRDVQRQLALLWESKYSLAINSQRPEEYCRVLKELEASNYYSSIRTQNKVRELERGCNSMNIPTPTNKGNQPSNPCQSLCARAQRAVNSRTQLELWRQYLESCPSGNCTSMAQAAVDKMEPQITCQQKWEEIQVLKGTDSLLSFARIQIVQLAEEIRMTCPDLAASAEEILLKYGQLEIASVDRLGNNSFRILFNSGTSIKLDPSSAQPGITTSQLENDGDGWVVPDQVFQVSVWDNKDHVLTFMDLWGNTVHTEISKVPFVWRTYQDGPDEIILELEGGRSPFVLEFFLSEAEVDERPVHQVSLGNSREIRLLKNELPPDIEGTYILKVRDRFKRVGMTEETATSTARLEPISLEKPWKPELWMVLLPILVLVSGFIFYRNTSFSTSYS